MMRIFLLAIIFTLFTGYCWAISIYSSDSSTLDGLDSTYFLDSSNQNAGILPTSRLSGSYTGITSIGNLSALNVGNLSFSSNSILSTSGGIVLSPLSGQSINVLLSNTGDFAINTNMIYVDTSLSFIGIGTAKPQRKLSVVGDVQCTGNIYESNMAYGEMFVSYNTTAMNLVLAETYYTVTSNVQAGDLKNVTFTNSGVDCYLTIGVSGTYAFRGSLSFSGSPGDEVHGGMSVNDAEPLGCCEFTRKMGAAGDVGSASFSGIQQLTAGQTIRVKIENETDADDPTIETMNFSLYRITP